MRLQSRLYSNYTPNPITITIVFPRSLQVTMSWVGKLLGWTDQSTFGIEVNQDEVAIAGPFIPSGNIGDPAQQARERISEFELATDKSDDLHGSEANGDMMFEDDNACCAAVDCVSDVTGGVSADSDIAGLRFPSFEEGFQPYFQEIAPKEILARPDRARVPV